MPDERSGPALRLRLELRGAVQGVGFRPFVFRLAEELDLPGWVLNDARGVFIEVEGARPSLDRFRERVVAERPPRSIVQSVESVWLPPAGYRSFEIRHSDEAGAKSALVLPDLATCPQCLAETLDPAERRHRYPFTNCTNCGPRFTILRALPYDRPNTTMLGFVLCNECRAEYEDPRDRRFHAQPIACPACGPRLALWDAEGEGIAIGDEALLLAAAALGEGRIVAVKGLGGFHLLCDARDASAVGRLRERKPRVGKPLAIMARDLEQARELCEVSDLAARWLESVEAPILLLPRRHPAWSANVRGAPVVAAEVAPGNPNLGVMLPATPLHHLLLRACGFPVVATSGNLTDEPICTNEYAALRRLGGIADLFLVHDRPIERHVDDSVAWIVRDELRLLRRARGWAPLPVTLRREMPTILAVGAHLKNTVALSLGRQVFLSQHIGDLETEEALSAFERVIADFLRLYEAAPEAIAHDLHPDYLSTRWALGRAADDGRTRLVAVQHHHAHLAACLAENGIEGRALGVTWDGTGYGTDGTVWGGEFLLGDAAGYERVAHWRQFPLPGGEAAIREPRRTALGLLWALHGGALPEPARRRIGPLFTDREIDLLLRMLERRMNCPLTSSAGRLFDGIAALLGLPPVVTFEGEAAMALEWAADAAERGAYPVDYSIGPRPGGADAGGAILDWAPLVSAVLEDLDRGETRGAIAARFHNALVRGAVRVAREAGEARVALSGGCFQNRILTERLAGALEREGHEVLLHRAVPPNDGCVSLGQAVVAAARIEADGGS
ncbi:MAG TPA: carbamoyltransferase HypF [Terriglobales bacterium]|nr:carbamoyltransferase HypF [Terriglobales bacterium]